MSTPRPFGNASLLVLLSSAIAACGDTGTTTDASDAGASDSTSDSPATSDSGSSDALTAADGASDAATSTPACTVPADCRTFSDYCGACACEVLAAGAPDPTCDAGTISCLVDPCQGMTATCDGTHHCAFMPPTVRRPFLVGSSMRSATAIARNDWSRDLAPANTGLDRATATALGEVWLKDGLEEHASVAAFARFTMLLLSVGAPPDLVARSQKASLDEINHARACFAFAERYLGRASGPSGLVVHDSMAQLSLAEIAALTAEEGCVGETLGAALAAEQLAIATDPETIAALRKIAADETRHAELAWRFVKWAVNEGGDDVKRAVALAVERAIDATLAMELRSYDGIDLDAWHAHGRLTCAESRAIAAATIRDVVRPCMASVLGSRAAATSLSDAANEVSTRA